MTKFIKATRALVLSSGGCDSTSCVGLAVKKFGTKNVSTVSVFYGQRHAKELKSAQAVAKHYGLSHFEIDLSGSHIMDASECALLCHAPDTIEHSSYADQIARHTYGMANTYVPFRNGLFLSSAASLAMSVYPNEAVVLSIGIHADDAAGSAYADCSPTFVRAMKTAIESGSYGLITLEAPFVNMSKAKVVGIGLELNVPFELTWSCYEGAEKPCGTCATCRERLAAFAENGVTDPLTYENACP